jgi:hypothetical protein
MKARNCFKCGKLAEPPVLIARHRLLVICRDCRDQLHKVLKAEKRLEKDIRSGRRCYICCDVLDAPGSTAVPLHGTLRRVCPSCKEWVEHRREGRHPRHSTSTTPLRAGESGLGSLPSALVAAKQHASHAAVVKFEPLVAIAKTAT